MLTYRVALLVALISALAFPKIASSQEITWRPGFGSELVYQCKAYVRITSGGSRNDADIADGYQCLGYIDGFEDGLGSEFDLQIRVRNRDAIRTAMAAGACTPPHTLDTLVKVYLSFMEKNPKYLDENKGTSLRMAFNDAYPCK